MRLNTTAFRELRAFFFCLFSFFLNDLRRWNANKAIIALRNRSGDYAVMDDDVSARRVSATSVFILPEEP